MSRFRALALLAPTIVLWGVTPLAASELSRSLPVLWMTTFTSLTATVTLAVLGGLRRAAHRGRAPRGPERRGRFVGMAMLGVTGLFPYIGLLFLAFSLAPEAAGEINVVNYTWPIWVVALSALILREPVGRRSVLGLILGFAGAGIVITGGSLAGFHATRLPAFLAAAVAAFFWGLYSVRSKAMATDPLVSTAMAFGAATVCFAVIAAALSPFRLPTAREAALIVLLGAGGNGIGYLLWSLALRSDAGARVSGAIYLTPFVALVWLWVFGRAEPRWYQPVALLLVVAGAALPRRAARRPPASGPS